MTLLQQIITIAMVVLGTAITRFLPFIVFPADKPVPKYVQYLGKVLPSAVFGLLRDLLPAKREHLHGKSRDTGADFHCSGHCTASLETADAFIHRRWNHMLYAAGAAGVLIYL